MILLGPLTASLVLDVRLQSRGKEPLYCAAPVCPRPAELPRLPANSQDTAFWEAADPLWSDRRLGKWPEAWWRASSCSSTVARPSPNRRFFAIVDSRSEEHTSELQSPMY